MKKYIFLAAFSLLVMGQSFSQTATVSVDQDSRIPELLALKARLSKQNELADRYKIQLYYGNYNQANTVRKKYLNQISEYSSSIEYETPNYKVWIGNFRNKLEADRALLSIQRVFPDAFIFKPER